MDHLTISVGIVRTACQIYNVTTLIEYYSFYTNGILVSIATLPNGRVGQAIYFRLGTSYFQAFCFSFLRLINPTSLIGSGSLIHISAIQNGSRSICYDLLAFSSTGALIVQWIQNTGVVNGTLGRTIPVNTWTHIAVVYGLASGLRLFVNGLFSSSSQNTNNLSLQDYNVPIYITLSTNSP
ncbi:hypothetical protein I4U23_008895 [Adineta vaga]|nr:hypothetical protein I4U23_008895 [Adineta vaga]